MRRKFGLATRIYHCTLLSAISTITFSLAFFSVNPPHLSKMTGATLCRRQGIKILLNAERKFYCRLEFNYIRSSPTAYTFLLSFQVIPFTCLLSRSFSLFLMFLPYFLRLRFPFSSRTIRKLTRHPITHRLYFSMKILKIHRLVRWEIIAFPVSTEILGISLSFSSRIFITPEAMCTDP